MDETEEQEQYDTDDDVSLNEKRLAAARDLNNQINKWYEIPVAIGNNIKWGFILYLTVDLIKHILSNNTVINICS